MTAQEIQALINDVLRELGDGWSEAPTSDGVRDKVIYSAEQIASQVGYTVMPTRTRNRDRGGER